MRLTDVYEEGEASQFAIDMLYDLLLERPAGACISHRSMPTRKQHAVFVASRPYAAWFLIEDPDDGVLGSVYLTCQDEIGIFVFRARQRTGIATGAIRLLMSDHPRGKYLANVSPENEASIHLFDKLGFRHIQNTYSLEG